MALNNEAVLVLQAGNYFVGPTGADIPADLKSITTIEAAGFINVGHTSLEDVLGLSSDGGEATVLGTLQNKNLRTTYSKRTDKLRFTLLQFDADALKLYFGKNMIEVKPGLLGVPDNPQPTIGSFLAVFIDGDHVFAFYAPKAELFRGDDLEPGDSESFAGMPIDVTPVNHNTNQWAYAVTPLAPATNPIA